MSVIKKNSAYTSENGDGNDENMGHFETADTLECITGSVILATATAFDEPAPLPFENKGVPSNQSFLNDIRNLQVSLRFDLVFYMLKRV